MLRLHAPASAPSERPCRGGLTGLPPRSTWKSRRRKCLEVEALWSIWGVKSGGNQKQKGPKRPRFGYAIDSTVAWGDVVTLLATEIISDRIPMRCSGMLSTVLIVAWVGVAVSKGDYRASPHVAMHERQEAMARAVGRAILTWALMAPTALLMYSSLSQHGLLDLEPFMPEPGAPFDLAPQVEVMVAALWSTACWRGIYVGLRPFL